MDIALTKSQIGHPLSVSQSPSNIRMSLSGIQPEASQFSQIHLSIKNDKQTNPFFDYFEVK